MHHLHTLQKKSKIVHLDLTNTDAADLQMLINSGFNIATNQVPCNIIDRRVIFGRLNDVCLKNNVSILAYGTL